MAADAPKTAEDVKAIVAERDIRFIRFWFTDVLGRLKSTRGWASTGPR
jgi:glutamine synthetase